ncbi:MAG TPA: Crp/Fnr family transcriptional regulator [Patescibacteria group bacterium]|nr:Crp/Fnr family transcriptional regulator [Patescibacteria group bacterium]
MKSLNIIKSVSPGFDKLLSKCRSVSYESGESILYQGEVPRNAYLIKSGVIKVFDIGTNGDEKIVALSAPGEFIPPAWVFNKSPVSLYNYEAFGNCTLYILDREVVHETIKNDDDLARKMFDQYIGLYTGAVQQVNALEQSKGADKVLYILQYLILRFGSRVSNDAKTIMLRLTHQDIASMTGLTRETTSVELNRLKKNGVISYKDQYYTVSTSKLLAMLGSDDFMNFKY